MTHRENGTSKLSMTGRTSSGTLMVLFGTYVSYIRTQVLVPRVNKPALGARAYSEVVSGSATAATWPGDVFDELMSAGVRHISYVPDAGHTALINASIDHPEVVTTMLTTEEEGVAVATGAWLGGTRSVLLMQSSGVGNCINMLSMPVQTRTPLLMLVTMRGEWAEFNPWQVPMGQATQNALESIGVRVVRADAADDVAPTVAQAATLAYDAEQSIAVLISQRVLGEKTW